MMSDIIEAFKDNAQYETWLSGKSRKAVELKVSKVFYRETKEAHLLRRHQINSLTLFS